MINPNGCRLCGIDRRGHAIQYGPPGRHTWTQPTQQQVKERMHARRETKQARRVVMELEDQLYAEDPSDRADAYLALQAMEPDGETPTSCTATFREEPMPDTVYCGETGYHTRHTAWEGQNYYAWLDGDEGAGHDALS
jgi:hypothetical protein